MSVHQKSKYMKQEIMKLPDSKACIIIANDFD